MVTTTMVHSSVEARDMHVANGMDEGIIDSHQRMDEVLAEAQAS
jgi:hypothetical protein